MPAAVRDWLADLSQMLADSLADCPRLDVAPLNVSQCEPALVGQLEFEASFKAEVKIEVVDTHF